MTDTLYADVSEFQCPVNDQYPYKFLAFRSNDGTYRDGDFAANLAWTKHAVDVGHLEGFIVYFVWETNWQDTVATFKAMVGAPHPRMAVMIDVESWSGKIAGDQSAGINAARESLISWLGGNRARVIGYGNAGDLGSLWPSRGDAHIALANYSADPAFPGKIAHQFSDRQVTPPFGACDINSAEGRSAAEFADVLGLLPHVAAVPAAASATPSGDQLLAGQTLWHGHQLVSPDGSHKLVMQFDGNLVLYHGTKALWSTLTGGKDVVRLTLQTDSNLVLYSHMGVAAWVAAGACNSGATRLVVQNDGNLVLYRPDGHAVWYSHTDGK